jgi:hypothetical protein
VPGFHLASAAGRAASGRLAPLDLFAPLLFERDDLEAPLGDATLYVAAARR